MWNSCLQFYFPFSMLTMSSRHFLASTASIFWIFSFSLLFSRFSLCFSWTWLWHRPLGVDLFVYILLRIRWASWMCRLMCFIRYGTFSAIISSSPFSLWLLFPLWQSLCTCWYIWCCPTSFWGSLHFSFILFSSLFFKLGNVYSPIFKRTFFSPSAILNLRSNSSGEFFHLVSPFQLQHKNWVSFFLITPISYWEPLFVDLLLSYFNSLNLVSVRYPNTFIVAVWILYWLNPTSGETYKWSLLTSFIPEYRSHFPVSLPSS